MATVTVTAVAVCEDLSEYTAALAEFTATALPEDDVDGDEENLTVTVVRTVEQEFS